MRRASPGTRMRAGSAAKPAMTLPLRALRIFRSPDEPERPQTAALAPSEEALLASAEREAPPVAWEGEAPLAPTTEAGVVMPSVTRDCPASRTRPAGQGERRAIRA